MTSNTSEMIAAREVAWAKFSIIHEDVILEDASGKLHALFDLIFAYGWLACADKEEWLTYNTAWLKSAQKRGGKNQ